MRIDGFIWLEAIVEKLWRKHQVDIEEVVDVFERKPAFRFVEKGHRPAENVYSAWGRTRAGRYLAVFFIWKQNRKALVVSARDMTRKERRRYDQNETSSISKATSYEEIGEFWDQEDLTDHWESTRPVKFDVELGTEAHYYSIEPQLAERIGQVARSKGISSETLVNLWLQEKLREAG